MKKKYVYWQDDNMWLGYLEEYPDYWTQGETEEELKENLFDIYQDLTRGAIPNIRSVSPCDQQPGKPGHQTAYSSSLFSNLTL